MRLKARYLGSRTLQLRGIILRLTKLALEWSISLNRYEYNPTIDVVQAFNSKNRELKLELVLVTIVDNSEIIKTNV